MIITAVKVNFTVVLTNRRLSENAGLRISVGLHDRKIALYCDHLSASDMI